MAERKTFRAPIELKDDGEEGAFRSIFSTLGVVDHDMDIVVAGAFQEGQEVVVEGWNHDYGLPPGKGVIHADEKEAWIDGLFFLDTTQGRNHYDTLKALGGIEEWSYTFDIIDSGWGELEDQEVRFLRKLDVWGVAPVTRGASIDTRTVALKSAGLTDDEIEQIKALLRTGAKGPLASHSTPTTDANWDGPANETRARSGEDEAYYKRIYAWRDADGDSSVKSSYKFIHHMVDGDGNPGSGNIRACQTGIGVLNGGRGGTTIPDGDRKGVWDHLARHLRDADVEPPELKALDSAGDGEGEADEDGKPSGWSPRDMQVRIDILKAQL